MGATSTKPVRAGRQEGVCPVCLAPETHPFFEMASVPVYCNRLWPTREKALQCAKGDIQLVFCRFCGFIGNRAFEPERMDYDENYENSLHFSPRFQDYAEALATHLIARYDLHGKNIIEIGCGKGEFLAMLCKLGGNRGVGFDRSYVTGRMSTEVGRGIQFIQDFYSELYAGYPCDLICCRHTLEHIHDPAAFLAMIRRNLDRRPGTAVFFEVPHALFTLRDMGIWDIIYEHCSYFCPESLARLFTRCGFHVREVREVYEGQFLCIEALPGNGGAGLPPASRKDLERMARDVTAFGENYRRKVEIWRRALEQFRQTRQRAVIWGAGSKGVTFLNTFPGQEVLEYAVDVNPHKQGLYVPGTGQKIVPPEFLRDYRPDAVLVMNPIYRDEITRQIAGLGLKTELIPV